jgi:hypothetical protein
MRICPYKGYSCLIRWQAKFSLFWPFLKKNKKMNLMIFFPNLALLSCATLFGTTYEGVVPVHMAQFPSTVAPVVPRQFSHVRVLDVTHAQVTP